MGGGNGTVQGPVGLPGTRPLCVPCFLDYGKQPSFASLTFPKFQWADSSSC